MEKQRSKKVYVVNKSSHDFSNAEKFGEIIYLSEGSFNRFSTSIMWRTFSPFIKNSKPTDYILLTSMNVMCSLVCAMFASKHHRLNLLIFQVSGTYAERTIILEK